MRFVFKNLLLFDNKNIYALAVIACLVLTSCELPVAPTPEPTPTPEPPPPVGTINIKVLDSQGNRMITDVIVRVAGTGDVDGDEDGLLRLFSCNAGQYITAWSMGYYISQPIPCENDQKEYTAILSRIDASNRSNLFWTPAGGNSSQPQNCAVCHFKPDGTGEYPEWRRDGHSSVFLDPYFKTIYQGNSAELFGWKFDQEGHQERQIPSSLPYYGTGFKLDYPTENGNCAYCHAPAAAIGLQTRLDLTQTINEAESGQTNSLTEGITCDICHKAVNVKLGDKNIPYLDKPGVLSFEFIHENRSLMMGPFTDSMNINGSNLNFSCAPIFSQSEFCAPCHSAKFWDTQIYNSYGEWAESAYAKKDGNNYKTCQTCHMLPDGVFDITQAPGPEDRESCSPSKASNPSFNHDMMLRIGGDIEPLIKQAAKVELDAEIDEGKIVLHVKVRNVGAGHNLPTDSPLRHLILVIEATSENGSRLPLIEGDTIPPYGGQQNSPQDYAGDPGKIYANILMDEDTSFSPAVDYWNPVKPAWKESDTRIKARSEDKDDFTFALPSNKAATFVIKLIYRYAFIDLARQKGWPVNDIIAECEILKRESNGVITKLSCK